MDGNAAQFPDTPILVASDGLPRIEFYKQDVLIDTMMVHRFSAQGITDLLVEMGQKRDVNRSWKTIEAEKKLFDAFNPHTEL